MVANSNKLLYICQKVDPYIPEDDRSESNRKLIQSMQEHGNEIRTFMPRFGCINERRNQLHEVIRLSGMNLIIDDTDHQLIIKVASLPSARAQVYFIDNDDYFARKAALEDESGTPFEDNDERSIFFARGVIETVKKLRWEPSVIHVHGWFSALVPAYIKEIVGDDPIFAAAKIVVTIDQEGFSGEFGSGLKDKLIAEGISESSCEILANATYENLYKFVLSYADGVVLAADSIDETILEAVKACGKPVLEYQNPTAEDFYDNYNNFYVSL